MVMSSGTRPVDINMVSRRGRQQQLWSTSPSRPALLLQVNRKHGLQTPPVLQRGKMLSARQRFIVPERRNNVHMLKDPSAKDENTSRVPVGSLCRYVMTAGNGHGFVTTSL